MPPQYSFALYPVPETLAYRQPATISREETLPRWLADLPADRPLVLAAIGTALPMVEQIQRQADALPAGRFDPSGTLSAIVAGLSILDCVAVVATGGIPVHEESAGDNVHLVTHVPQPLLLQQCAQLFLTHGGYNSIREAMVAGVPMAVLPQFGDQLANADRVQELGLGARIPQATPAHVADTCGRMLADSTVTAQARQAQRHMLALPPVDAAVADLERLSGLP